MNVFILEQVVLYMIRSKHLGRKVPWEFIFICAYIGRSECQYKYDTLFHT